MISNNYNINSFNLNFSARKKDRLRQFRVLNSEFEQICLERTGIVVDEKAIIRQIQKRELEFNKKYSNRITSYKYKILGQPYILIYDKEKKQLISLLYDNEEYKTTSEPKKLDVEA